MDRQSIQLNHRLTDTKQIIDIKSSHPRWSY